MESSPSHHLASERLREYFDTQAPVWDSRLTAETLRCLEEIVRDIRIAPGSSVLDVGCGTGVLLPFLATAIGIQGEIVEMDISEMMLEKSRSRGYKGNIRYLCADVHTLPEPDNVFDIVICNNSFPHFGRKEDALLELKRVIKPGGRLVICHSMNREAVNNIHRTVGGVIAHDLIPENAEVRALLARTGYSAISLEDSPERYLVIACK